MEMDIKQTLLDYTGLSPLALATFLVALVGALYLLVNSGGSARTKRGDSDSRPPPVKKEPINLGDDVTDEELKLYDGSDESKPLLLACKGVIYDVSSGRAFYGPGGAYDIFAGRDASRALAKMSFEEADLTGDLDGLSVAELETLESWASKFSEKYEVVGRMKGAAAKYLTAESDTAKPGEVRGNGN